MPAHRPKKNRLRAYMREQKQLAANPLPPGFAVCPAVITAGIAAQQAARNQNLYTQAYAAARQNVIPYYLRPILGTGN